VSPLLYPSVVSLERLRRAAPAFFGVSCARSWGNSEIRFWLIGAMVPAASGCWIRQNLAVCNLTYNFVYNLPAPDRKGAEQARRSLGEKLLSGLAPHRGR